MLPRKDPNAVNPQPEYENTSTKHVFLHKESGKFYYSDETEYLNGPYESEQLALQGMHDYLTFSLDGPANLKDIETRLDKLTYLSTTPWVRMVKDLFAKCRGEEAILTLRHYANELREHSEPLYHLVMNKPRTPAE